MRGLRALGDRWETGLIVLTVVVVTAYTVVALRNPVGTRAGASTASPSARPSAVGPELVVLGDGMAATTSPVSTRSSFAMTAARLLGWRGHVDAEAGTGYVTPRISGATQPFAGRVARVAARQPQLVIVVGGTDDARSNPPRDDVRRAAVRLLGDLRTRLPRARIVVLGPFRTTAVSPASTASVRDALRAAAAERHVTFVDPIAERWVEGPGLLAPNGTGLTAAGHAVVGLQLAAALPRP